MKTLAMLGVVLLLGAAMFGCGKKEAPEAPEQMSMESVSSIPANEVTTSPEAKMPQPPQAAPVAAVTESAASAPAAAKLEPLPPPGPFKPSPIEIQTALKNAGYYTGAIDGKIGKVTKKAIEEFQKANNLKADGRVGPKTWELLKTHLTAAKPQAKR